MPSSPCFYCLLLLLFASGCSDATTAAVSPRELPPPRQDGVIRVPAASRQFISVETVSGRKSGSLVTASAHVEFRDGAVTELGVPLNGRVVSVHIHTGDTVKEGDPIVTLDCPEAASLRASVDSALANLREAEANLDRQVRMLQQGVGVERDKLAAETKVSELKAEVAGAEAHVAFIGMGTGTTVVLYAPIDGTVLTRKASVGMAVQQGGDPIAEIGNSAALWIVADVFERDLGLVHGGAGVRMELPSLNAPLHGRVSSIGTVVASGLRTAPVRIMVDPGSVTLRPGMYGRAQIEASDADITLPTDAVLIKDGKESVVYVEAEKDSQTFVRRTVVIGQHVENGRVQIVSGLLAGEKVVVKGALLLDGSADQLL